MIILVDYHFTARALYFNTGPQMAKNETRWTWGARLRCKQYSSANKYENRNEYCPERKTTTAEDAMQRTQQDVTRIV